VSERTIAPGSPSCLPAFIRYTEYQVVVAHPTHRSINTGGMSQMAQATLEEVTRLAEQLSPEERRTLIEHLSSQPPIEGTQAAIDTAASDTERAPRSLRGLWAGHFPEDFDIDAVLYEIRHEWEKEWPELFEQ
jgi:hypothetical protein